MNYSVFQGEVEQNLVLPSTSMSNNITSLFDDGLTIDDYQITELTWKDGQLVLHGSGSVLESSLTGTFESTVNQANSIPSFRTNEVVEDELPCWFDEDKLPPVQALSPYISNQESLLGIGAGCSTKVKDPGSRVARREEIHHSVCQSRKQIKKGEAEGKRKMMSASGNKSRSVHNLSERKRRNKFSERIRTLHEMLPVSSRACKMDKASVLEEGIRYIKRLQAYIRMLNGRSMSTTMSPLALQQQFQLSMMYPMGSGVLPPHHVLHPNPYTHKATWKVPLDRLPPSASMVPPSSSVPHPVSASLKTCQSQPMTMKAIREWRPCMFQTPAAPESNRKVT